MHQYYSILGLAPNATKEQIKKAYRKKAMQYHPDRNREQGARQKFLDVLEAYEYLMGSREQLKRAKYKRPGSGAEQTFEDLMQDLAKKRAKEKYRERVREFRKKQAEEQSKEFVRAVYILVTVVMLVGSVYLGNQLYKYLLIAAHPSEAIARVYSVSQRQIAFQFLHNDTLHAYHTYVGKVGDEMVGVSGMPIVKGDEFVVRYNAAQPKTFMLLYHRATPLTIRRYIKIVSFKLQRMYEKDWVHLTEYERQIKAQVLAGELYRTFGLNGLCKVYFNDTFFLENIRNNSISWFFFSNNQAYQKLLNQVEDNSIYP